MSGPLRYSPPFFGSSELGTIKVAANGSTVLNNATKLDFTTPISVSVSGATATITVQEIIRDLLANRPAAAAASHVLFIASDVSETMSFSDGSAWHAITGTAASHSASDFDAAGSAATVLTTAEAYTDSSIAALSSVYQPLDSDLTAIAALSTTSFGRSFLTLANAGAGRTLLGLGTAALNNTGDFDAAGAAAAAQAASQPLDSDLTAIAALSTTSFGRGLLTLADAAAGRSSFGLGTAATHDATDFDSAGAAAAAIVTSEAYTDAKIIDSIADSDTTHAPSRNAVFDALALKASITYVDAGDAATLASADAYADGKVIDSIADSDTTHAPSRNAVFDALALKVAGPGSATSDDFAMFNGTTGEIIKDNGTSLDTDGTMAANADTKIPSQKAVVTYVAAHSGTVPGGLILAQRRMFK